MQKLLYAAWLAGALGLAASAAHALAPEEQLELATALDAIAAGPSGAAAARAGDLLRAPTTDAAALEAVLADWYATRLSTEALSAWLGAAAFDADSAALRERLQPALAGALTGSVSATFAALLPAKLAPALEETPALRDDLRTQLHLLADLAFRGEELPPALRRALFARLERLVARHADVLRADVTLDVAAQPRVAALRAQLHKILRDLPRPFDAEAVVRAVGMTGLHAEILRKHGVLVLDDNGFDLPQLDAIAQVLTAIPAELHRLTHISQHDLLGNLAGSRPELELRGGVGVNLFATPVYAEFENPFPPDVAPRQMRTFCGVLQHELNHAVDELTIERSPALRARREALLLRAGRRDALQYVRSMFPPETFPDAPQELFASLANVYLTDSAHTLALAEARRAGGRTAPLDQFLFFAEVYSRGGDHTLFFVQDEECNYSAYVVPVRRDARGRIEHLRWPGGEATFTLDLDGFVLP